MWKFQDFSTTQNLREINFGHFETPKTAILSIWAALNFEFFGIFDTFKREMREIFPNIKIQTFDLLQSAKIDLTQN